MDTAEIDAIRQKLITGLDVSRAKTHDLIKDLAVKQELYPGWTVKEYLSHLTGWDDAVIEALEHHAAGREPPLTVLRGLDFYMPSRSVRAPSYPKRISAPNANRCAKLSNKPCVLFLPNASWRSLHFPGAFVATYP